MSSFSAIVSLYLTIKPVLIWFCRCYKRRFWAVAHNFRTFYHQLWPFNHRFRLLHHLFGQKYIIYDCYIFFGQSCQPLPFRRSTPLFLLYFRTPLGVRKTHIFPLLKSLERFFLSITCIYRCSIFVKVIHVFWVNRHCIT